MQMSNYGRITSAPHLPLLRKRRSSLFALAVAIGAVVSGQASAQQATGPQAADPPLDTLEEIVVTARKRVESVQDVPEAISVLSQQVIKSGNLDQVEEFVELVPNTTFTQDSETSSEISIRGSSRNLQDEDPSVGVYRDGIYVGGLLFSTATFYDTERVEILRGPQAALYGRNAVGGAVNVVTERPSFNEDGYVNVRVGNKSRQEVRSAVNVPLVDDKLAVRLSGLLINQDRGFDYVVNQDYYTDAEEVSSVRGRLLFQPSEDWEFLTTFEYIDTEGGLGLTVAAPDEGVGYLDSEGLATIPGTTPADTDNQFRDWPMFNHFKQFHAFQEVNWSNDIGDVTGIISYRDADYVLSRDDDYSNFLVSGRRYDASQESFFSELRFTTDRVDDFDILVGLNYIDEKLDLSYDNVLGGNFYGALGGANLANMYATGVTPRQFRALGIPTGTPISALGLTPGATGLTGYLGDSFPLIFTNKQTLESFAAFGDVTYKISPKLEVWGNARYTHDKKTTVFGQNYSNCPVACPEIIAFLLDDLDFEINGTNQATFENLSLGGGVNFKPDDSILAYAKVVQGFKAGGFNSIAASLDLQAFDSEKSVSYEIGLKTEFLDNRLRVNLAAFQQDRTGTLIEVVDPLVDVLELGVNAGKIRNKGVELEVSASPAEGLRLDVAGGYLDAKFKNFAFGDDDFTGNHIPRAFKYSLSAILTYEQPISGQLSLFSYASYRNAWDGYTDNDNQDKLSSPEVVDLRLGVETANAWRVSGYVDNVFDHRYTTLDIRGSRIPRGIYSPGRTYGMQLGKEF